MNFIKEKVLNKKFIAVVVDICAVILCIINIVNISDLKNDSIIAKEKNAELISELQESNDNLKAENKELKNKISSMENSNSESINNLQEQIDEIK